MVKMEQVRMDSWAALSQHLSEPAAEIPLWLPLDKAAGWAEERRGEEPALPDAS